MEPQEFTSVMRRVRQGDPDAAAALVKAYEPEIRRYARMRLTNPRLKPIVESMDVCQSVLANFFVRAAAGQFVLDEPTDLLKLLGVMVRNKVNDVVRRQKSNRRDWERQGGPGGLETAPAPDPTASRIAVNRELLQEVQRRLSEDERYLADQRALGRQWAELAQELGETSETLRKRHQRAVDRVAKELRLDESISE